MSWPNGWKNINAYEGWNAPNQAFPPIIIPPMETTEITSELGDELLTESGDTITTE